MTTKKSRMDKKKVAELTVREFRSLLPKPTREKKIMPEESKKPITKMMSEKVTSINKEKLDYILNLLDILRHDHTKRQNQQWNDRADRLKAVVKNVAKNNSDDDVSSRKIREELGENYQPYKKNRKTFCKDLNDLGRINLLKVETKKGTSNKVSLHETLKEICRRESS